MKEILDKDICIYKNVIKDSDKILEELFEIFNRSDVSWVQATINNHEYNKDLRSCKVFSLYIDQKEYSNPEHVKLKTMLNAKINKILSPYILDYLSNVDIKIKTKEAWEFLQYSETEKLEWHSDHGDPHPCLISFVLYFNDDYEGGEIQFKDYIGSSPYKPEAGSLIIFPSDPKYLHRVLPVLSGTKIAAISFAK
jgi:predicted 2-oxoglutarate/Fe(II)-dependent dioxygenase YbiX